jgi:hypothetical protein
MYLQLQESTSGMQGQSIQSWTWYSNMEHDIKYKRLITTLHSYITKEHIEPYMHRNKYWPNWRIVVVVTWQERASKNSDQWERRCYWLRPCWWSTDTSASLCCTCGCRSPPHLLLSVSLLMPPQSTPYFVVCALIDPLVMTRFGKKNLAFVTKFIVL